MSSAFEFDYDFSTSASETNTYTVFGETITPDSADQTLVVSVPLASLKSLLTVGNGWSDNVLAKIKAGEQIFPTLNLSLAGAHDELVAIDTPLRAFSDSEDKPMFGDSVSAPKDKKSLQAYLHDPAEMTSDDATKDWLLSIPSIAIRKTEVSQQQAQALEEVIPPVEVLNSATEVSPSSVAGSVRGLFEQMVNANKVNSNDGSLDLVAGDSISFFVNYSLAKSYSYQIDTEVSSTAGTIGAANFTIGGTAYSLPTTGLTATASATKKMKWMFVATGA